MFYTSYCTWSNGAVPLKKIVLRPKCLKDLHQNSIVLHIIISATKEAQVHIFSTIITGVSLCVFYLFFNWPALMAGQVS